MKAVMTLAHVTYTPAKVAQEVSKVQHGGCHLSVLRPKGTLLGLQRHLRVRQRLAA